MISNDVDLDAIYEENNFLKNEIFLLEDWNEDLIQANEELEHKVEEFNEKIMILKEKIDSLEYDNKMLVEENNRLKLKIIGTASMEDE